MIDEKGKLFGKINIIDLLVLLVVVIAAVVLAVKFLGGGGGGGGKGGTTLTYTVMVPAVLPEVYNNIQEYIPGGPEGSKDQLMASGELLDGYVVSVTGKPHQSNATITTQDGALVVPLDRETFDLTFEIQVKVTNKITNEVGTQEVRIGKQHIVKTQHFELTNGTIIDCDWSDAA